jgi:hypothetical protein
MTEWFELWWSGGHQELFGWPLHQWERIASAVQFLSGLVILFELIGPERLGRLERGITSRLSGDAERLEAVSSGAKGVIDQAWRWLVVMSRYLFGLAWYGVRLAGRQSVESIQKYLFEETGISELRPWAVSVPVRVTLGVLAVGELLLLLVAPLLVAWHHRAAFGVERSTLLAFGAGLIGSLLASKLLVSLAAARFPGWPREPAWLRSLGLLLVAPWVLCFGALLIYLAPVMLVWGLAFVLTFFVFALFAYGPVLAVAAATTLLLSACSRVLEHRGIMRPVLVVSFLLFLAGSGLEFLLIS